MSAFHPELRLARFLPAPPVGRRVTRMLQRAKVRPKPAPDDMLIENVMVPGPPGQPPVLLRLYRPKAVEGGAPALFWIHGGGFILGSPQQDESRSIAMARELGITVAAVGYRLAPDHPAPAATEDVYAGLRWLFANAESRGIARELIAIGGASAGGGLAAALALLAHDRGEVAPVFQLLLYPMLDDRTVLRTDMETRNTRLWRPRNNRFGWSAYLGRAPGGADVSPYAAPARREELNGLPPAWIGVGTLDLFHDEDVAYARRLNDSGVPCALHVVPGAFHAFDRVFHKAGVSREFWRQQTEALRAVLRPSREH
ncbi:alpha/beta hydrolase [Streptosporangium sp. KLBMP 9127]|nr:alpha/beta hydrolase [Streptosporangium sp. KLBMP 9127]